MEDVDVPVPNPFIAEWLVSVRCQEILLESATRYAALYQEVVAKRTGRLAESAQVSADIEGDRWVALMSVGDVAAFYAASHEFGTGPRTEDLGEDREESGTRGAHDLNTILDMMATL